MSVQEYLPICDEEGRTVGQASREVIHAQGLLHRAVHVLVFNPRGELFLQRRGPHKDSWPGVWDTSVGGHVGLSESDDQAAWRELQEELGIDAVPQLLGRLDPDEETGWEFVTVYTLVTDQPPRWDGVEITDGRWAAPDEVARLVETAGLPVTPSFRRAFRLWQRLARAEGAQPASTESTA